MRAENFWALPARGEPAAKYLLVPIIKNDQGKALPRPEGALDAQVYHPLKKAQGRRKGSQTEIRVAKVLNQFFYGGLDILRRTPLSGGWAQGLGDVCASPESLRKHKVKLPPVYVECKRGQGISYESLLNWSFSGTPSMYTGWLKEAVKQADGRTVLLVVQGDGQDPWVIAVGKLAGHDLDFAEAKIRLSRYGATLLPLKDLAGRQPVAKERDGNVGNIESG